MKVRTLIGIACTFPIFMSCSQTDLSDIIDKDRPITEFEESLRNYTNLFNRSSGTRSGESFTLSPYIYEGDTVMYVVRYNNGWELLSADTRYPMSVMRADKGSFDEESFAPGLRESIQGTARIIRDIRRGVIDAEMDESWNWLPSSLPDETSTRVNEETPDFKHGKWVLIDIIDHGTDVKDIPHLVTTHWHQSAPWNHYIPLSQNGQQQLVGCVAVAFGQYAYFLHHKTGKPMTAPNTGLLDSKTGKYVFSDFTSDAWNIMGKNEFEYSTQNSACLLGYIANVIGSIFGVKDTSADPGDAVTKYLNPATGDNYKLINADYKTYSQIISMISNGYPVLAGGTNSFGDEGHRFLIDSYRREVRNLEYVYGWDGKTMSGKDPNSYNDDGTIDMYGIQKRVNEQPVTEYFRMNWGWMTYFIHDDVLCSVSSWKLEAGNDYSYNNTIVVKE